MKRSRPSIGILALLSLSSSLARADADPIWAEGAAVTAPRSNPLQLPPEQFSEARSRGRVATLQYPVDVSGMLMPWEPVQRFLNQPSPNPIRFLLQRVFSGFASIRSTDDLFAKAGLHPYPELSGEGPYEIPFPEGVRPSVRMGATIFQKDGTDVFTISCAACHSSNLFGRKVLGLTNRFPRANEFFDFGKRTTKQIGPGLFSSVMGAPSHETQLYGRLRDRARAVGVKTPQALGLDTSLAQVALSLSHRNADDYATFNPKLEANPRAETLRTFVADSKPAVWWNLKYKNRWLSDGSVVAGNPIYTNFLWNEIGRGTDLHELEDWLDRNSGAVRDLTTAVFATEAPRYTDFFPAEDLAAEKVKRGQQTFQQMCAKCHGTYVKNWALPESSGQTWAELIRTVEVRYPEQTRVIDVGTDPQRYQGMKSLETGLNPLAISRKNGVVIKSQTGYVPPPLVGIWARWPYFHNNSAPSLCAVLTPGSQRPKTYLAGEANDPVTDFDRECNGYPSDAPAAWKQNPEAVYDTTKPGLSNSGHDEKIFVVEGRELLTPDAKRDLIQYLQTL